MWHGLSGRGLRRVWYAGCGLSRGRRDIAGHGCEVWAGLGLSRVGVEQGVSMVEHG